MRIFWVENNSGGYIFIIMAVIFLAIFAALFVLNIFSAKNRLTFYIDGQDVKKFYYKFNEEIVIPEDLSMFKWYTDEECTIEFNSTKMGFKEINLYTKTKK